MEDVDPIQVIKSLSNDGNVDNLIELLDSGIEVNKKYEKYGGSTMLHYAAGSGLDAAINLLLDMGANMMLRNNRDHLPANYACYAGHVSTIELFLDRGFPINDSSYNISLLSTACVARNLRMMEMLVNRTDIDVNLPVEDGMNSLMFCCFEQDREGTKPLEPMDMVKLLTDHGADPNLKSNGGMKAIQIACEANYIEVVGYLLKWCDIEKEGHVLIQHCCIYDNHEIVKLLLDNGVDPDSEDGDNKTPLHNACICSAKNTTWLLLSRGADHLARRCHGNTPLMFAKGKPTEEIMLSHIEWNKRSELLGISQDISNENSTFHYLGVCLYDVMDLLFPEKPNN